MIEKVKISALKLNPANPRTIRDDKYRKLLQSVAQFPAMLDVRGIVVDAQNMILGGNQRWRAILDLLKMPEQELRQACGGNETAYTLWEVLREKKSVPGKWILDGSAMTPDEIRRFIIADNVEFGEHDWDALANEWDADELADWGVDVPGFGGDVAQDAEGSAGGDSEGDRTTLAEKFIIPPFSVFDTRQGYWQARKRQWLAIGIKSELGRGGGQ